MLPVEGHKNLFRDEKTNAIINSDETAYNDYMTVSYTHLTLPTKRIV